MIGKHISISDVAASVPYDNSTSGLVATDVQAAIDESRVSAPVNFISASNSVSMSSSTDANMPNMTYTNTNGVDVKVLANFNGDISIGTTGAVLSISFYLNGVQVADTLRKTAGDQGALAGAFRNIASTMCKVVIPNGQTLTVRWSVSSGTITAQGRSMSLLRCGDF